MDSYKYTKIVNSINTILGKSDFENLLSSKDVESGVKNIVDKPIGLAIYDIIRRGSYGLDDVFHTVNIFNKNRLGQLYMDSGSKGRRAIKLFNNLFNMVNLISIYINLLNNKPVSIPYPYGDLVGVDFGEVKEISELLDKLPSDLKNVFKKLSSLEARDYSILFNLYLDRSYLNLDYRVRRIYGFIRDLFLLKTCLYLDKVPENIISVASLTLEDFVELCSLKSLDKVSQRMRGLNPFYDGFVEVLNDVYRMGVSLENLDLSIYLYVSHVSNDLLIGEDSIVTRLYVLYLAETMLLKHSLASLESRIHVDELKSVINKWWVI